jgi:hypothetical protein
MGSSFKKLYESANDDFKDVFICGYESAMCSDEIIRRASGHKSLEAYLEYVKLGPQSVMYLVESTTKTRQNRSEAA